MKLRGAAPVTIVLSFAAVVLACVASACSSSSDSGDAPPQGTPPSVDDTDATAPPPPPPPPPKKDAGVDAAKPPQVYPTVESRGGKVIKNPKIVPITFTGDTFAPNIEDFIPRLAGSQYWNAIASEYGVGALTVKAAIRVDETPASLDDTQVQTWLQGKFDSDARFGAPDGETLYAIFYPEGVSVTLEGKPSCATFGGYHNETIAKSTPIGYSVVPHCGGGSQQGDLDLVTAAQSHEALEWATDPFPYSGAAYAKMDEDHWIWSQVMFDELGDMCFTGGNDVDIRPTELGGYLVQRTWSNAQSLAGHDPCVPYVAGAEPYFTAIPQLPDSYQLIDPVDISLVTTQALEVPMGQSRTIDVKLYSDGPTSGPWDVRVVDLAQLVPGGPADQSPQGAPEFTYALDKTSGASGDVLKLTVTSVAQARKGNGFVLISTLGQNVHVWPAMLVN